MLYPDFHELVAFKEKKSTRLQLKKRVAQTHVLGSHSSSFRGRGLEFDAVREYVLGDDIRNIDWRVTARKGFPHLKLFKQERERRVILCVDMNASMQFGTRKTFKSVQAAHVAAFLGWKGIAAQDRVSTYLFGDVPNGITYFKPSRTRSAFYRTLKALASPVQERHSIGLKPLLKTVSQGFHKGAVLFIISDFIHAEHNKAAEQELKRLNQTSHVILIAIHDLADRLLPPIGRLRCFENEAHQIEIDTDSIGGREAYAKQWNETRQHLRDMARSCKIPLIELTTEMDVRKELKQALKMIARRGIR